MKNTLLLPLLCGLALAGCTRHTAIKTAFTTETNAEAAKTTAASTVATDSASSSLASTSSPANSATNSSAPLIVSVNIPPPIVTPDTTATRAEGITPDPMEVEATPAAPEIETAPAAAEASVHPVADGVLVLDGQIADWKLTPGDITEALRKTDRIERTKDEAGAPTGPMDTGMITDVITGKFQADADVTLLKLNVMVVGGVATLTGSSTSPDKIGRAIALALDTDGVSKVISKIKLEPATPQP